MADKVQALRDEIAQIKEKISQARAAESNLILREVARKESYSALTRRDLQMQPRRALRGHTGKVHALHWSTDSRHIVSVSQDNKMIVWNAFNSVKQLVVPLRSKWIATCAFSPSGRQVAAGGFGGSCSVYRVGTASPNEPVSEARLLVRELVAPPLADSIIPGVGDTSGRFATQCRFVEDQTLVVAYADRAIAVHDVETGTPTYIIPPESSFSSRNERPYSSPAESHSLAIVEASSPAQPGSPLPSIVATAGEDAIVRVWDTRSSTFRAIRTFSGHDGAINSLCFFSDGLALASASEDTTCRLWDLRSSRQLNQFVVLPDAVKQSASTSSTSITPRPAVSSAAFGGGERVSRTVPTSISCSSSGRILFVGYDDCLCRVWDTIDATSIQVLEGHDSRVSSIGVAPNGRALCTGSWDSMLRVWS